MKVNYIRSASHNGKVVSDSASVLGLFLAASVQKGRKFSRLQEKSSHRRSVSDVTSHFAFTIFGKTQAKCFCIRASHGILRSCGNGLESQYVRWKNLSWIWRHHSGDATYVGLFVFGISKPDPNSWILNEISGCQVEHFRLLNWKENLE